MAHHSKRDTYVETLAVWQKGTEPLYTYTPSTFITEKTSHYKKATSSPVYTKQHTNKELGIQNI